MGIPRRYLVFPSRVAPYPRAEHEGVPESRGWRRWAVLLGVPTLILLVAGGICAGVAAFLVALGQGDEWVCSHGEAPAGNACYPVEGPLPPGVSWDPLGNRPMPYNCDKDGWTLIARGEQSDCLNDNLPVPSGWHIVR